MLDTTIGGSPNRSLSDRAHVRPFISHLQQFATSANRVSSKNTALKASYSTKFSSHKSMTNHESILYRSKRKLGFKARELKVTAFVAHAFSTLLVAHSQVHQLLAV